MRSSPKTGIGIAIAGRCTPLMRPNRNKAAAIVAPVLPAPTIASARPSRTASAARTIDESFFARTAAAGSSSIAMISAASSSSTRAGARPSGRWVRTASAGPTSSTSTSQASTARSAPATIAAGARSPPIASIAITGGTGRSRYSTSRTWRPRYQPQLPQTRWGSRDAPQFGHSECAGGARRMFADLRERVAERLILRFGTAMVSQLLVRSWG